MKNLVCPKTGIWHNHGAFVALVTPLDSFKGLQVHTCGPLVFINGFHVAWARVVGGMDNGFSRDGGFVELGPGQGPGQVIPQFNGFNPGGRVWQVNGARP